MTRHPIQPRPDLIALARVLREWIEPAPGVPVVYLFGSRVRGDHRPDSDVDVRVFPSTFKGDDATSDWWDRENDTCHAELKAKLPGPLALHRDATDGADPDILTGRQVYKDGRVVCVWTPPREPKETEA